MDDKYDLIDLSLYKLFYIVCQNESFSKTANVLGLTQPSVSYNIKKLEDELGVKLFERGNTLSLTPEGEELLPHVIEALNSLKNGEKKINDLKNLRRGQVSIGIPSHIGVFLLTDIVKCFNKDYKNIKIKVICKPTKELFKLLKLNEIDIVIDSSPLDENLDKLSVVKLSNEKCAFACNKNQVELLNKTISLKDISKYQLIVPSRSSNSTKKLIDIFNRKNIEFNPMFEIYASEMIAEMVDKELGIGYLFEKTIERYTSIEKINIDCNLPTFDIFMIYKNYLLSSASLEFIKFVNKTKRI